MRLGINKGFWDNASATLYIFRLYLINSPVVRGDDLRFQEEGVRDILKAVMLPWFNAYRFLEQNVVLLEKVSLSEYWSAIEYLSNYNYILEPRYCFHSQVS